MSDQDQSTALFEVLRAEADAVDALDALCFERRGAARTLSAALERASRAARLADLAPLSDLTANAAGFAALLANGAVADVEPVLKLLARAVAAIGNAATTARAAMPRIGHARPPLLQLPDAVESGSRVARVGIVNADAHAAAMLGAVCEGAGMLGTVLGAETTAVPDAVLIMVAGPQSLQWIRDARAQPGFAAIPIVAVDSTPSAARTIEAFDAGATDVVSEVAASGREIGVRLTAHLRQLASVRELALRDAAIGCYTARYFRLRLEKEIRAALRQERELTVAMLEIDGLHELYERDHLLAERAQAHVASTIAGVLRGNDVVARHVGDRLAVLLCDADLISAAIVAERFNEAIARADFTFAEGDRAPLSVTIGLGTLGEHDSSARLLGRAATALGAARTLGPGRISVLGAGASGQVVAAEVN